MDNSTDENKTTIADSDNIELDNSINSNLKTNTGINSPKKKSIKTTKKPQKTKKKMDVDDAINEYYILKNEYKNQNSNKCINCKKPGGTTFTSNNGILTAICNSNTNKCKLNIEINRGKIIRLDDYIEKLIIIINDIKINISKLKLDLLFGYKENDQTIEEFNILKKKLTKNEKLLVSCMIRITDINKTKQKEMIDNISKKLSLQNIDDFIKINTDNDSILFNEELEKIKDEYINVIKSYYNNYKNSIKDNVNIDTYNVINLIKEYVTIIYPLNELVVKNKKNINKIENKYYLLDNENDIIYNEMFITRNDSDDGKSKIISFIK